jgi:hypothetical protein
LALLRRAPRRRRGRPDRSPSRDARPQVAHGGLPADRAARGSLNRRHRGGVPRSGGASHS